MGEVVGKIIAGNYEEIQLRRKSNSNIELGELMIAEGEEKILLQAYDLTYSSQFSPQKRELMAGIKLEEKNDLEITNSELKNYTIASLKPLLTITQEEALPCKNLPKFFSDVRKIEKEDLKFLIQTTNPLHFGNLRSGSTEIDFPIKLDGEKTLSHHILITAQTGRGKSNLVSCMLWDIMNQDYAGMLVLDPHDEYYGRGKKGLKDHMTKKIVYYTNNLEPGSFSLKINIKQIKPYHFNGVFYWSEAQRDALILLYSMYGKKWIQKILELKEVEKEETELTKLIKPDTLNVIKRRLMNTLDLSKSNGVLIPNGIFEIDSAETTVNDIITQLENRKTVIIDTSKLSGQIELLVGSIITTELFNKYKREAKKTNDFQNKPTISIVLEEAPRVLGKDILEKGTNIFSTIAREGRKFKISLTAITQLPSLIPKQILANMSTKIILGMEMENERDAIINSSAQDLSKENKTIASLNKGEAILTSTFSKFAIPLKIPLFKKYIQQINNTEQYKLQLE